MTTTTCPTCAPLLEAGPAGRERSELDAAFDVLAETVDKADSATMWWRGSARCKTCGLHAWFDYRHGPWLEGRVTRLS